jgi:hypothetical protein
MITVADVPSGPGFVRAERRGRRWQRFLDGCGYAAAVALLAAGLFTLYRLLSVS